jgi:hypothetical protein
LAIKYGLLPLREKALHRSIRRCWRRHRRFLQADIAARDPATPLVGHIKKNLPRFVDVRKRRVQLSDRAFSRKMGFIPAWRDGVLAFCFAPRRFRRIYGGHQAAVQAARALKKRGELVADVGLLQTKLPIRTTGKRDRVYCVTERILEE